MAVARVVEHARRLACPHLRQHVGQHGAQAGPGHDLARADVGETLLYPLQQGADAVGADVAVAPLNSAVPATRKRSRPKRLLTSLVASSSRLTTGAAAWLASSSSCTVME